jgi:hypothetical protein
MITWALIAVICLTLALQARTHYQLHTKIKETNEHQND